MRCPNYRKELPEDAKFWSKCELEAGKGTTAKVQPYPRRRAKTNHSSFL